MERKEECTERGRKCSPRFYTIVAGCGNPMARWPDFRGDLKLHISYHIFTFISY